MSEQGRPSAPTPQRSKSSFWRSMRIVAWGFFGVRKRSEYQQDLAQVNPFHVVLAGVVGLLLLVLLLLGIVNWVVSGSTPAV